MEIENKIREFILKRLYYGEDGVVGDTDSFLETGVIDSMGVMELVAFVQSEFGLKVDPQEIIVENFDSICKLADFVRRKLAPTQAPVPARERMTPARPATLTSP